MQKNSFIQRIYQDVHFLYGFAKLFLFFYSKATYNNQLPPNHESPKHSELNIGFWCLSANLSFHEIYKKKKETSIAITVFSVYNLNWVSSLNPWNTMHAETIHKFQPVFPIMWFNCEETVLRMEDAPLVK